MATPRYRTGTISASLKEYTNREQDLIKQGFSPSNFTYLSKFPEQFKPSSLSTSIRLTSKQILEQSKLSQSPRLRLHYEWMPDDYNQSRELKTLERKSNDVKRKLISKDAFKATGKLSKGKNQEGFSSCPPSYISIDDPFQAYADHIRRIRWVQDCHILDSFYMKTPAKTQQEPDKAQIVEIISFLKQKIAGDWPEATFALGLNAQGLIEIRFSEKTIEQPSALLAYMNVIAKTQARGMQRVTDHWGELSGSKRIYVFRPAWVKQKARTVQNLSPQSLRSKRTLPKIRRKK